MNLYCECHLTVITKHHLTVTQALFNYVLSIIIQHTILIELKEIFMGHEMASNL